MPPGGETSRYSGRFGENVLPHGSHEWLPYSKDEKRLKTVNNNFSFHVYQQDCGQFLRRALVFRQSVNPLQKEITLDGSANHSERQGLLLFDFIIQHPWLTSLSTGSELRTS